MTLSSFLLIGSLSLVYADLSDPGVVIDGARTYFQASEVIEVQGFPPVPECPPFICPTETSAPWLSVEGRLSRSDEQINFFRQNPDDPTQAEPSYMALQGEQDSESGSYSVDFVSGLPVPMTPDAPPDNATSLLSEIQIPPEFDALFCERVQVKLRLTRGEELLFSTEIEATDVVVSLFRPKGYCSLKLYHPCSEGEACSILNGGLVCGEGEPANDTTVTPASCDFSPEVIQPHEGGFRWQTPSTFVQASVASLHEIDVETSVTKEEDIGFGNSKVGIATKVESTDEAFSISSWERMGIDYELSFETADSPFGSEINNVHLKQGDTIYSLFTEEEAANFTSEIVIPPGKDGFVCESVVLELLSEDGTKAISVNAGNLILANNLEPGYDPCDLNLEHPCIAGIGASCVLTYKFDFAANLTGDTLCESLGGGTAIPPPIVTECIPLTMEPIIRSETLQVEASMSYFKGESVTVQRGSESVFIGAKTIADSDTGADELKAMGLFFKFMSGDKGTSEGFTWKLMSAAYEDAQADLANETIEVSNGYNAFHCDQVSIDLGKSSLGEDTMLTAEDVTMAAFLPFGYVTCQDLKVYNPCRATGQLCRFDNGMVSCVDEAPVTSRNEQDVVCKLLSDPLPDLPTFASDTTTSAAQATVPVVAAVWALLVFALI